MMATDQIYIYAWKNNPVRARWYGRRVRIVHVYKAAFSVLIETLNDPRRMMVTSRRALRKEGTWKKRQPERKVLNPITIA